MPRIWAATCDHQGHPDLSGQYCHQVYDVVWDRAAAEGLIWVSGPASELISVSPIVTEGHVTGVLLATLDHVSV